MSVAVAVTLPPAGQCTRRRSRAPVGHAVLHHLLQHPRCRLEGAGGLHEGLVQPLGPGQVPRQRFAQGQEQLEGLDARRRRSMVPSESLMRGAAPERTPLACNCQR